MAGIKLTARAKEKNVLRCGVRQALALLRCVCMAAGLGATVPVSGGERVTVHHAAWTVTAGYSHSHSRAGIQ